MTDSPSELVAAARHLAQWGRSRQTVWHDASSDLLAALGDRYASFDDLQSTLPPPLLPPVAPRPQAVELPPLVIAAPEPMPVVAPPPPAAPAIAITTPVKTPVRTVTPAPRARRAPIGATTLVTAAIVVVAALASPALWHVWKAYEASRIVPAATNTLTIESTPPGAVVLIDGVESGKTPLSTSLMLGLHHLELRYRKNVRTLDVDVVAGDAMLTRIDWSKRPPAKKRPAAKGPASDRGAMSAAKPSSAAPPQPSTPPPDVPTENLVAEPDASPRDSGATGPDAEPTATAPSPVVPRP